MASRIRNKEKRIAANIKIDSNGCHIWQGIIKDHYAFISVAGKQIPIHVYRWEKINGKVPKGLLLDHTCRVRNCVNPEHMEPVTHVENVMRGDGPAARNARKTHCIKGHELIGDNLGIHRRKNRADARYCKACNHKQQALVRSIRALGATL